MTDTDIQAPFPSRDPWRDDSTRFLSVSRYRRRSRCKHSGYCKFLALIFPLRRWKRGHWSSLGPWSAEQKRERGEHERITKLSTITHRHAPATLLPGMYGCRRHPFFPDCQCVVEENLTTDNKPVQMRSDESWESLVVLRFRRPHRRNRGN